MDIVWQAEESLREKKRESDLKDLLKTLVAFANSVAPGDTATLLIGEKDDGTVQGVTNPDNIQKKVKKEADNIYPEIRYDTSVYERNGMQCVRIDVKHNGLAPHFGGAAWVRRGSVTVRATEQLYQQMVELRQSKVFKLSQWLNKEVTVDNTYSIPLRGGGTTYPVSHQHAARLVFANNQWATFETVPVTGPKFEYSEPLEKLHISWDEQNRRLKVLISNPSLH